MSLARFGSLLAGLCLSTACAAALARPAVVELYTSEGCSSCPPADKLLEEMAKRPDVLALSFHVDYWDGLGWRDRFSMQEATRRQQDAARTLALTTVGTPQWIVEGRSAVWGASPAALDRTLKSPRTDLAVEIMRDGQELRVRAAAPSSGQEYTVYLIGYLPRAVTAIGRGENAGRTLTEVNVVRYIRMIGTSRDSAREWRVPLAQLPSDATRVAVLLQMPASGEIVGARSIERGS
ncbi:MAG TPA: DUF1223 domain-containing protein [Steroidobacteraceae bacterium]|nr:DUF1223 domain-containing protein [Steroidobacteraceae bacterium]